MKDLAIGSRMLAGSTLACKDGQKAFKMVQIKWNKELCYNKMDGIWGQTSMHESNFIFPILGLKSPH